MYRRRVNVSDTFSSMMPPAHEFAQPRCMKFRKNNPMAKFEDRRGLKTTVANRQALEHYDDALQQLLSHRGDPLESINAAIEEDPDFVMAYCVRARCETGMAEGGWTDQLIATVNGAKRAAEKHATDRERMHIDAIEAWANGYFQKSLGFLEIILREHPRDIYALQFAHHMDLNTGNSASLRDRIARALTEYDEATPGYGYVLGMYAFGLEECVEYARAEDTGHKALEFCPDDVWAIHAVAHVYEMQGRHQKGIDWYESREMVWALGNEFATHNWWHVALFNLDLENHQRVLEIFDSSMAGHRAPLQILDASALLWRMHLLNWDVGDRWNSLADRWEQILPNEGFYCFYDCHALMAYVATERHEQIRLILDMLERASLGRNDCAATIHGVGLPVVKGLAAFGNRRYAEATEILSRIRHRGVQLGGSHAQRDFIFLTLIESAIRAKCYDRARAFLSERAARRPSSAHMRRKFAQVSEVLQWDNEA